MVIQKSLAKDRHRRNLILITSFWFRFRFTTSTSFHCNQVYFLLLFYYINKYNLNQKKVNMLDILFKKKYQIVLGKNWNPIASIYLSQTPRAGEYIYINDELGYLNVLNVVHRPKTLSSTTFIIVEKANNKENLRG